VREYEGQTREKEAAMKAAVGYCITHDILKDFLEEKASEVINMLLTEWNWDDALEVRWQEGLEEGLEKGLEKGLERGHNEILDLINSGYTVEALKERLMAEKTKSNA
jgi:flagellar biosynthesis/type III secretory pathway protein FliH